MVKRYKPHPSPASDVEYDDDVSVPSLPALPPQIDDADEYDAMGSMLEELSSVGGDGGLSVYSLPTPGDKDKKGKSYVMHCGASDHTLHELFDLIRDDYGPGLYEICGTLKGKIRYRRRVLLSPLAKKKADPVTLDSDGGAAVVKMVDEVLKRHTDSISSLMALLTSKLDKPAIDPMDLQSKTIGMLATMRDIFAPPMSTIRDTNPPPTISHFKELLELRDLLRSDDGGGGGEKSTGDVFMSMADRFLPVLAALGSKQTVNPTAPKMVRKQVSPKQSIPLETEAMKQLRNGLDILIKAASRNADVEFYAELVVDQLPADILKSFVTAEGAIEKLVLIDARVADHRQWFDLMRETIIGWVKEADEVGTDNEAPYADTADGNTGGTAGNKSDA